MREIITLQIGGCGNSIGNAFWNLITHEHGVDSATGKFVSPNSLQLDRISVLFNATANRRFYARAICVDTEAGALERISKNHCIYRPENFVSGLESAGNSYARGFHTDGAAILEDVLNCVRREAESVDSLQGFQIIHSVGGGTGSGLTALIMASLVEEYPDNLISNYVVIPSPKLSQVVVEPYNTVLSIPSLVNCSHLTFCLDNEALFQITTKSLRIPLSGYEHINHIVALTMSGITTCLRFPGQLNAGLRKIYVNMVPFPPLHFLIPGFAPLTTARQQQFSKGTVGELVQQLFSSNNLLCAVDLKDGKLLTAAGIFRGRMSPREVDHLMTNVRNKNIDNFVEWIPNNIKTAICDIPPRGLKMSATFIGNTTSVQTLIKRLYESANAMWRRKAHLHWYTGEGMEESELVDALKATDELITSYKDSEKDDVSANAAQQSCQYCEDLDLSINAKERNYY